MIELEGLEFTSTSRQTLEQHDSSGQAKTVPSIAFPSGREVPVYVLERCRVTISPDTGRLAVEVVDGGRDRAKLLRLQEGHQPRAASKPDLSKIQMPPGTGAVRPNLGPQGSREE